MSLENFYYFECGAVITLIVLILWISFLIPGINQWNRRFFITMFAIFLLCMISLFVDLLVWDDPSMALAEKIVAGFEYLLFSIPLPMFTAYLLKICGEERLKSNIFRAVIILCGIYFILLGIAQFTTFFYYVTPDNHYIQGPWHSIFVLPVFVMMFINLFAVIRRRNKFSRKYFVAFLIHLLPLYVSMFLSNIITENLMLVTLGLSISMLSLFVIILYDQIEQYLGQQREIANQRASIMVLQMRPHFIYNAMMSIYYLCAQNPQKAQEVTLDFTTYLRKNFTAIASEDIIPFSDELEHTKAYLAIEQVQFGDDLLVEYDISHENFRLPPLTLQPIVENAVKHGMDPEYAPLCISVKTRKTDFGSEIAIEDNGSGFDFNAAEKPNSALKNIRQRLEMMCGGEITIRPREGGGTVVTVIIP